MPFPFLQRANIAAFARQLTLTSYEPSLALEGLVPGIDNVRHDVFLSPKFTDAGRVHIFKLIARHGNVEELAAEEPPARIAGRLAPRIAARHAHPAKAFDHNEFRRLLVELHVSVVNRAKAENNVALDLLFRLAVLKFQRAELLNQYNLVLERCRARIKQFEGPRHSSAPKTMEMRERFARFQINKKAILRRAGQDLFFILREAEKE